MRKIRELLRLKHNGRSQRQIASSLSVATGTGRGQLRRAREAGITWERAQEMTDGELEALLFRDGGRNVAATRAGKFDGDEFGSGECVLYLYGPNADALFDSVQAILRSSKLTSRGWAVKRYGRAGDPTAREQRVNL